MSGGNGKIKELPGAVMAPTPKPNGSAKALPAAREKIAFCVPSLHGSINHDLNMMIREAENTSHSGPCPYEFQLHTACGKQPVWFARNLLVDSAMKAGADRIWFLDDDIIPPPNVFSMLLVDADIVSGCVPIVQQRESGRCMRINANGYRYNIDGRMLYTSVRPTYGEKPIFEVDAAGTAAMIIKRKVFEDERMKLPREFMNVDGKMKKLADTDEQPYFHMLFDSLGRIIRSEDLDFCTRAKDAGYRIMYDFEVVFGHNKNMNLAGIMELADSMASKYAAAYMTNDPAEKRKIFAESL